MQRALNVMQVFLAWSVMRFSPYKTMFTVMGTQQAQKLGAHKRFVFYINGSPITQVPSVKILRMLFDITGYAKDWILETKTHGVLILGIT